MSSVTWRKNATQVLARLPRNLAARVVEKIEEVAADPYGDHPNVAKLKGREGHRLRVATGGASTISTAEDGE